MQSTTPEARAFTHAKDVSKNAADKNELYPPRQPPREILVFFLPVRKVSEAWILYYDVHAGTDPLELQREAKELLELSQSLQPDMESVNHGIAWLGSNELLMETHHLPCSPQQELST